MNEERFTGLADTYEAYRPGYPDALFDYLYTTAGLTPESVVADVGAGTGIFSRSLLARGSRVFCVEPNADMMRVCRRRLSEYDKAVFVSGTAEDTTLPDRSADAVVVAQAFHWFDKAAFAAECRRFLRPDGFAALVWNSRDEASPLVLDNDRLNREYCPAFQGFTHRGDDRADFAGFFRRRHGREQAETEFFTCEVFRNDLSLTRDGFIGRNLSSSYALKEGDARYEDYMRAMNALFDRYAQNGTLRLPQYTRCYVGDV